MALAAGMVPCPGVVLVMLYFISMDLIWLGLLSALAVSLGMAVTINLVGLLAFWGKGLSMRLAGERLGRIGRMGHWLEMMAALAVLGMGVILMIAAIQMPGGAI